MILRSGQYTRKSSGRAEPESLFGTSCRTAKPPSTEASHTFSCSAELEVAAHEKKTEKAKDRKTEGKIGPPGPRSIQGRRHWQPSVPRIEVRESMGRNQSDPGSDA